MPFSFLVWLWLAFMVWLKLKSPSYSGVMLGKKSPKALSWADMICDMCSLYPEPFPLHPCLLLPSPLYSFALLTPAYPETLAGALLPPGKFSPEISRFLSTCWHSAKWPPFSTPLTPCTAYVCAHLFGLCLFPQQSVNSGGGEHKPHFWISLGPRTASFT